uniref:Uncharacterized protein n=1 Tax=Sphaerodactylus townsendi TaxID=933632 RepID=A0ACB8FK97_9SAUR
MHFTGGELRVRIIKFRSLTSTCYRRVVFTVKDLLHWFLLWPVDGNLELEAFCVRERWSALALALFHVLLSCFKSEERLNTAECLNIHSVSFIEGLLKIHALKLVRECILLVSGKSRISSLEHIN